MPAPLRSISARAPGLYGLNTQASAAAISPRWALAADNLVFDDSARLVSRKGSQYLHASAINGGADLSRVAEYVKTASATYLVATGGNKISVSDANDFTTWTDKTAGITTPTDDNWKFVDYNGYLVGVQAGHTPIDLNGSGAMEDATFSSNDPGQPIDVLSAFGRLWWLKSDGHTIVYSGILDSPTGVPGTAWHASGSGSFDVSGISFPAGSDGGGWMAGNDFGIALAALEDKLIIFGRNQIAVFGGVADPNSDLYGHDTIAGVGCIARDSIQHIGTDILFVDATGLRSLSRTIQNEKMPVQDMSKNVRDDFIADIESDRANSFYNIESGYVKRDGFYVVKTPGRTWVFDLKFPLEENKSFRTTTWSGAGINGFSGTFGGTMYMAMDGGYVAKYYGFKDRVSSDVTGGEQYSVSYKSSWQDFSDKDGLGGEVLKFPKIYKVTVKGIKDQYVDLALAYDFGPAVYTETAQITNVPNPAEWGSAEWGEGEWSGNAIFNFEFLRSNPVKYGQYIQMQIAANIFGAALGIQTVELLVKMGRYAR